MIEQLNESLKGKYPALYRVVGSLLKSSIKDLKENLKTARPVTRSGKNSINSEIEK
ncbi:hypothetical protein LACDD01_02090 [Lactococcus sp. DD01]|nr:hypothetical protein LACDD01_02090 [Lactococcus sp. DD01]